MHEKPAVSPGPAKPFGVELSKIWDVKADATYDVRCARKERRLVAIRTHAGAGMLESARSAPIVLGGGTLLLLELSELRRYRCRGPRWDFWWFEFGTSDPLPCALSRAYLARGTPRDREDFMQVFTKLQNPSYTVRCVASVTFGSMLHRWLAEVKLLREPSPHRLIIETMIERIHANSADDWSVPRLAAESGLSESVLRREFRKATGRSPARFVREARLGVAAQLIQQGIYTLATIAEQLNFSSPFHLSTAFKNHFGVSPSELRKEEGP